MNIKSYVHNNVKQERGMALVIVFILLMVVFLVMLAYLEFYQSTVLVLKRNQQVMENRTLEQEAISIILTRQNQNPLYLFTESNYEKSDEQEAVLKPVVIRGIDTTVRGSAGVTIRPNPMLEYAPEYNLDITVTQNPSQARGEAHVVISPVYFSGYQYYSEDAMIITTGSFAGKVYAPVLRMNRKGTDFWHTVEYGKIENEHNAIFHVNKQKMILPYPSLRAVIDFQTLKRAAQSNNKCGKGIGLYLGPEGSLEYQTIIDKQFKRSEGIYQIDLTRLRCNNPEEFIEYRGTVLPRYDSSFSKFNGVIYVEGELHIWGISGGRSAEDFYTLDKEENPDPEQYYRGPDGYGNNAYSNNVLDAGEDWNNNGYLDEPGGGCTLIVVTAPGHSLYIDHNIFQIPFPNRKNHTIMLISGGVVHLSSSSPKTTVIEASIIALGKHNDASFIVDDAPRGRERLDNYWAKTVSGRYVYDVNADGVLSWDNHEGQPEDRNEHAMKKAHALIIRGNLILCGKADFGEYYPHHILKFMYDAQLVFINSQCCPFIPVWKIVKGSVELIKDD
jgi:hypothetical protein